MTHHRSAVVEALVVGRVVAARVVSRDGHIANSENSQNYECLDSFLLSKECSDGAGNSANRKISKRRFSSLVLIFSQLKKFVTLELIKVEHFVENACFPCWG